MADKPAPTPFTKTTHDLLDAGAPAIGLRANVRDHILGLTHLTPTAEVSEAIRDNFKLYEYLELLALQEEEAG